MCAECGPEDPKVVAAHEKFEEAMRDFLEAIDYTDGITVDWVLVVAQNVIFEHGSSTMLGSAVRREQPAYRTTGLLTEILANAQAGNIAHSVIGHLG
jgi:hypothetical protein